MCIVCVCLLSLGHALDDERLRFVARIHLLAKFVAFRRSAAAALVGFTDCLNIELIIYCFNMQNTAVTQIAMQPRYARDTKTSYT